MTIDTFAYCIENTDKISVQETKELRDMVDRFPYFQAARALYLKGLKNSGSFRYAHALKSTAIQTTDRRQLFELIHPIQKVDIQDVKSRETVNIKEIEIVGIEDISTQASKAVDKAIRLKIKEGNSQFHFELEGQIIDKSTNDLPHSNEKRSFSAWLSASDFTPIDRSLEPSPTQTKNFDIINNFIALNPKIKPMSDHTIGTERSGGGSTMQSTWMTETLAKIYEEQKNYDKAIRAYRILSLKYPEKSAYFARQIKTLTALKAQNNT